MSEYIISFSLSAFGIFLTALVGIAVRSLQKREDLKQKEREEDRLRDIAIEQGLRAMLRDRILQGCEHHGKLGYANAKVRTSMQMMYDAYHNLGGNGVVTDAYNNFRNLEFKEKGGDNNAKTDY